MIWGRYTNPATIENNGFISEYSKCRGNRYGYGKVLPQKIHFRVQKMLKMNFLKTNG